MPAAAAPVAAAAGQRSGFYWRVAAGLGAVLVLGTALLAAVLREPPTAASYRTVSDPAARSSGDIRAVFADTMTMEELHALLAQQGLRIVAGPTPSGVYTLSASGDAAAPLSVLREHPGVRFAEPAGP